MKSGGCFSDKEEQGRPHDRLRQDRLKSRLPKDGRLC